MKTATTVCGACGAKIPDDATGHLCPACLLEAGIGIHADDAVAGGDLSGVAAYSSEAAAKAGSAKVDDPGGNGVQTADGNKIVRPPKILGDLGDYELLEEIGRGGQGVVYRAHQKSLNRTVALKVIGLGPWTTEAHLKRFRREAEAAARLEHPCIVPIYEVGERDAQCYFSMKFIEGGQLDEVVRREPMPIRRAVDLIAKVARTVHYAHEHGILHRDIKPGNVLLDHNGEPHLTDFGLARLVETESTITGTLEALGTPSYMAPEQAIGETKNLTSATDVYGLGAVLYQLLTGQPPFAGGTTYETIRLLRDTEPRSPRLLNPKVDRDLSAICLKCLEKDPNHRYLSALALAEDLEHWLKHEPIQAKRSGFFTYTQKWVRRKPAIAALSASLVALAAVIGWNIWNSKLVRAAPEKSIAVLPFENLSLDADNAYFANGIQEEILTRLTGIADLKVISRASTRGYQSKPRNLPQIAKQLGVANILEGSVQKVGDQVRVNVQLINAQTDSHLWAETYDQKLTDIFGVESEIAKGIAESLEAKLTGHEKQALAVRPTDNAEAYEAYLRGLAFEARNASSLFSDDTAAKTATFLERAVQLDPNFATAWARLSRTDALIYTVTGARRDASKRALDNTQKLAPTSPETLLALGYYQYWVLREYGAAKTTFGRVSKMLPGNSDVLLALSRVARREQHWEESVRYSEQALALDPRNVELLMDATITVAELRKFPMALKLCDRLLDITPSDLEARARKALMYQAQGNLQEAASLLSEINWQTPNGNTFEVKIMQLTLERNYAEAIRLVQDRQARFHFNSMEDKSYNQRLLAITQHIAGDAVAARATAQEACNTLEQLCKEQPNDVQFWMQLSDVYAAMAEKDLALKTAEHTTVQGPTVADPLALRTTREHLATILTMIGENSRAISILTELLQQPYWSERYGPPAITSAHLRLDPLWDPLRGDPAFQKLCEEKQP
jgi:serine/threonine protein kinase/cytochrome c-type biogenesis protein CcmH/NrfG